MLHKAGVPPVKADVVAAMKSGGEVITDMAAKNMPTGMKFIEAVGADTDF